MASTTYDRNADLLYAYQFGQDFARTGEVGIEQEFKRKFAGDEEAQEQFAKGVINQTHKGEK